MEETKKYGDVLPFHAIIKNLFDNGSFLRFDSFIINEMGFSPEDADEKAEVRKEAFKRFRHLTDRYAFSSYPTMKRWFGIGGYSKPRREQVYEICFSLRADVNKAKEYLTRGLGEPSFQINDYQEAVFLYGLENGLSHKDCLDMIQAFERNLDEEQEFWQTCSTKQLMNQFQMKKNLPPEEFLLWMSDNAALFKGYSKTTLNYLEKYKKLIINQVRADAKERLDHLLAETNFESWIKKRKDANGNRKEWIKKYVNSCRKRNHLTISENLGNSILELSKIVYSEVEANTRLLAEVFSDTENVKRTDSGNASPYIRGMTGKYLSDLFNIPIQKERAIRTAQAYRALADKPDDMECPEWIGRLGNRYTKGKTCFLTAGEAKTWLEEYRKEHRRRCLLVQRGDILPLVLHVSQQRYLHEIRYRMEDYHADEAKKRFEELANATLSACNLALLSEEYELDVALMACFQEEEMYSYSDVLDAAYGRKEEEERA